jgi:2-dehydro-3-deoxyphosphooctonate aldolase (KDO 8-P synthase)
MGSYERNRKEGMMGFEIGAPGNRAGRPLLVVAGPCVLENLGLALEVGRELKRLSRVLGFSYVFKSSFDKANRTRATSYRGPGLDEGLELLAAVKRSLDVPVLTDVHESWQAEPVAQVADVLQVPAFLCRQTDLLAACGATGKVVNIKKGQFMSPLDMRFAVEKVQLAGAESVWVTERGTFFGYRDLVVDMRSLRQLAEIGVPVVFDATHSVQRPGAGAGETGGSREYVADLVRAAVAVGVDALFVETHPAPQRARSDAGSQLPLGEMRALIESALAIRAATVS